MNTATPNTLGLAGLPFLLAPGPYGRPFDGYGITAFIPRSVTQASFNASVTAVRALMAMASPDWQAVNAEWQAIYNLTFDRTPGRELAIWLRFLRNFTPLDFGTYNGPAYESARFMALERDARREFLGMRPLGADELAAVFEQDRHLSVAQMLVDDIAEINGLNTAQLWPGYDVQPYNLRDLISGMVRVGERINKAREAYETKLRDEVNRILAGEAPEQFSAEAQRIAIESQRQTVIDHTLPGNLPGNQGGTVGSNEDAIDFLIEQAAGQQESEDVRDEQALATWTGTKLAYWEKYGPKVEVFREDNANLASAVLWVRVTPQQKPKPEVSKFAKWGGLISFAISFIPTFGTILSYAVGQLHKHEIKRILASVQKPGSIFEPQYVPQTFHMNVPGGLAAGVVTAGGKPELLPMNVEKLAVAGYPFDVTANPPPVSSASLTAGELQTAQQQSATATSAVASALPWLGLAGLGVIFWRGIRRERP